VEVVAAVERSVDQVTAPIERDLGFSVEELADALSLPAVEVAQWLANDRLPGGDSGARLAEFAALYHHLRRTLLPEAIPLWLRSPNRYLGGSEPLALLRRGDLERIEAALEAIDSGFFV